MGILLSPCCEFSSLRATSHTYSSHAPLPPVPAFAMLARLDENLLKIEIIKDGAVSTDSVTSLGQSVHLIVEEGLEAFLPLSDMIDYAKERVSDLPSPHFVLYDLPDYVTLECFESAWVDLHLCYVECMCFLPTVCADRRLSQTVP